MKYILTIDQGTTSTRAILLNQNGDLVNISQKEVDCTFPKSGWVETDAVAIWLSVVDCINELLIKENISWENIDSIGITNQRETTVVWDKYTGLPICPAIVWQSRQSSYICDRFLDKKEFIHEKTGLLINPYFSASKIAFILENVPNAREKAEKGQLLFGTIDSWIIYRMTNLKIHATDVTNASRTMLFNINTMKWDSELCSLFNIPLQMLPKVLPSSHDFGEASFFNTNVHIHGVAGDQQAALFGQTCFNVGDAKNTYGTGCFMLINTGDKITLSKNGLLTTVAWQIGDHVTYALEGSVFIGGAVVQWLRDKMHIISKASQSEELAMSCSTNHDLYVVPAFTGLGTPYWDDEVRGAVFGMTRDTSDAHFVKACLEAIAYQCKDVFETMKKECHLKLKTLNVDGGAVENKYLMQFQSDILETQIALPKCLQTTALGASYLAGLSSGFFESVEHIKKIHGHAKIYIPELSKPDIKRLYEGWKKAVKAARIFKNIG